MIFDIDKTEYIAIVAGMDCLPSVHVNEVIDHTYIELAQNTAINHFANRFPVLFQENQEKHKLFLGNDNIQRQLSKWQLDPIKFWYLHLFIIDYATDSFNNVTIFEELSTKQICGQTCRDVRKYRCRECSS